MRNKLEGYYTKWHNDLAYVHLHKAVQTMYPALTTLPDPDDVLEYHRRWTLYVQKLRTTASEKRNAMTDKYLLEEKQWFREQDLAWSPPPELCAWKTPVPEKYFDAASGHGDRHKWSLADVFHTNLVPVPQADLVQDAWECSALASLRSADARACISLCRPHACHVEKRKDASSRAKNIVPTMKFQAGEIALRPLTPQEDEARGMLSGLVANPDVLKRHFALKPHEPTALKEVLEWLAKTNPWFTAYASSLREVDSAWSFVKELDKQGRLVAAAPVTARTAEGLHLSDTLGADGISVFMPVSDLSACSGSYRHLRAAADRVMRAQLQKPLPAAWQSTFESDICDADDRPLRVLPQAFRDNQSFTSVPLRDRHFDAKVFVQQHPYGTGSLGSTCDCVTSRSDYYKNRLYSLDGVFVDTFDPEWTFMMREREIKTRLMQDYLGKLSGPDKKEALSKARDKEDVYVADRFSHRIGQFIDESPQALGMQRGDWLEVAKPENLGAPTAMTTIVVNAKTSTIRAHVSHGPLAIPSADDSIAHLFSNSKPFDVLTNITAQSIDYVRRKKEFYHYTYSGMYDTPRGRVRDTMDRSEGQRRGHKHNHINEFHEPCSLPDMHHGVAMNPTDAIEPPPTSMMASADTITTPLLCRSFSRYCLKAGSQCTLPSHCNGTAFHLKTHSNTCTAELVRPFPLGSKSTGPPLMPVVMAKTLGDVQAEVAEKVWTAERLSSECTQDSFAVTCDGSLLQRLHGVLSTNASMMAPTFNAPLDLRDLLAAYYYRRVQIETVVHVCRLGYCRQKWDAPCKFNLPSTEVGELTIFLLSHSYLVTCPGNVLYSFLQTCCDTRTTLSYPCFFEAGTALMKQYVPPATNYVNVFKIVLSYHALSRFRRSLNTV